MFTYVRNVVTNNFIVVLIILVGIIKKKEKHQIDKSKISNKLNIMKLLLNLATIESSGD